MRAQRGETPDTAVRQLERAKSVSLESGRDLGATNSKIAQLNDAPDRLDDTVDRLQIALDLGDILGDFKLALVIDPCDVRRQLAALARFTKRRRRT